MTVTQKRFLDQFAKQLVDRGFSRKEYQHSVVLTKHITIVGSVSGMLLITWLANAWAVVKTQLKFASILLSSDFMVGNLMTSYGSAREIIDHIATRCMEELTKAIKQQL